MTKSKNLIEALGRPGHRSRTELDKLERRANAITASATLKIGDAPPTLSADARELWRTIAPTLHYLTMADRRAFARYCEWLLRYRALSPKPRGRKLKATERTVSRHGQMERLDKGFQALLLLDRRLMEYEDRFGMNPDARVRLLSKMAVTYTLPQTEGRPADGERRPSPIGILKHGGGGRLQ